MDTDRQNNNSVYIYEEGEESKVDITRQSVGTIREMMYSEVHFYQTEFDKKFKKLVITEDNVEKKLGALKEYFN